MKKLSKILIFITVILAIVAGLLFIFSTNKNSEKDADFYIVDYDSLSALDKQENTYYLLACDLHESKCQNIIKLLRDEKHLKYNVYYLDTTNYSENISKQELSDEERMNYILLFKEHMGKLGVESLPAFFLKSNGDTLGKLEDFSEKGYAELTKNELTEIVKQLNKIKKE